MKRRNPALYQYLVAGSILFSGCASTKSLAPQRSESLANLKKAAIEDYTETSSPRFSKEAITDAEMLQGQSPQEYRDNVIP